jgi:hypothetical protein
VWLLAAGVCAGSAALTKPEFELAALAAAAAWLALRSRGGRGGRREAALVLAPALAIPALVYGAFLAAVSPHALVLENLYPVDFFAGGGATMLEARLPLTAASFAELGARLALYAGGTALLVVAARALAARGRLRATAVALASAGASAAIAASIADPEALRHGLQFAYGWIPAGAVVAGAVIIFRRRKAGAERSPADADRLAALAALAVLAASVYAAFFLFAPEPQMAAYAVPLAAIFLVRLHLVELVRSRPAYLLGLAWLAFLVAAGVGLTVKDARVESATVRGSGGALQASPGDAAAYATALRWIDERTAPGEKVLLAPQLTWLYSLSGRENALPQISLLPGVLFDPEEERAAIGRLDRSGVRLAVIDRHQFSGYGHTAFGGSFDRLLDAWVKRNFVRVATAVGGADSPRLEIWLRRAS